VISSDDPHENGVWITRITLHGDRFDTSKELDEGRFAYNPCELLTCSSRLSYI
jgi:hypothetical protein